MVPVVIGQWLIRFYESSQNNSLCSFAGSQFPFPGHASSAGFLGLISSLSNSSSVVSSKPQRSSIAGAAGNVRIQTAYALQTKYLTARIEGQASKRLPRRCCFPFRIPDSQKWWKENTYNETTSEISVVSEISVRSVHYRNFQCRFQRMYVSRSDGT